MPSRFRILVNTAGSGKTRLLLQGLCRWWGFYFVMEPDTSSIGSKDLKIAVEDLPHYKGFNEARAQSPPDQASVIHLDNTARRAFFQVLLARFLILNYYLQLVPRTDVNVGQQYRRLWVLMQVQPGRIFDQDIFSDLSQLLRVADIESLRTRINDEYATFKVSVKADRPLFCVIDEAQLATKMYFFSSSRNLDQMRPELKPLWAAYTSVLDSNQMIVLLSGTGIHVPTMRDSSSTLLKGTKYVFRSNIGAFEDPSSQAAYIKYYIPARWTDACWRAFLSRAWIWFRGR
jgi:hypothetical protein